MAREKKMGRLFHLRMMIHITWYPQLQLKVPNPDKNHWFFDHFLSVSVAQLTLLDITFLPQIYSKFCLLVMFVNLFHQITFCHLFVKFFILIILITPLSKLVQTCSNLSKLVQTCTNLVKIGKTCKKFKRFGKLLRQFGKLEKT